MEQEISNKKNSTSLIVAIILAFIIIVGLVGTFLLYKIEKNLSGKYKLTNSAYDVPTSISTLQEFFDRLKSPYSNVQSVTPTPSSPATKPKSGSTSNQDSSSEGESSGIGGIGESGVLDTDVPWREEGEPDLDYSYLEVRACGAAIKGPPEIGENQQELEQAYHDYLAWTTEDCRAAYREAGKEPPF